jgi:hypothetical protein
LNSVLTKVMWKPLECKSLARCIRGVTWPCAGKGTHTACGFLAPVDLILSLRLWNEMLSWFFLA